MTLDPSIYVLGQLRKAVRELATGQGDVRERLLWAARELQHASPKEIHPDLREALESVKRDLSSREPKHEEGTIAATIKGAQ